MGEPAVLISFPQYSFEPAGSIVLLDFQVDAPFFIKVNYDQQASNMVVGTIDLKLVGEYLIKIKTIDLISGL